MIDFVGVIEGEKFVWTVKFPPFMEDNCKQVTKQKLSGFNGITALLNLTPFRGHELIPVLSDMIPLHYLTATRAALGWTICVPIPHFSLDSAAKC